MREPRPTPAVWVTRPAPAAQRTAEAVRQAGFAAIAAPLTAVAPVTPEPMPKPPWPEWVILVSANAAEGLAQALRLSTFPPRGAHWPRIAAVGHATAEHARSLGFPVDLVPHEERAEGLVAALAGATPSAVAGKRVWIPAGNQAGSATTLLPRVLRQAGASVEVFQVYATTLRLVSPDEAALLSAQTPGAVAVHSSSAAESLFAADQPGAVRSWRELATCVAIGPTTAAKLRALGARRVLECSKPSDADLVHALCNLFTHAPRVNGA